MSTLHTKKPYARYISAVGVFLLKEENGKKFVLLQKRQNTGFADGFWEASAAGHVDEGEEMTDAVIHEATEELCVSIDKKDLEFICLVCKKNECFKKDTSRPGEESFAIYNGFFACRKWKNEIAIGEPHKCSEIKWFDINEIPENTIADRKLAVEEGIINKITYFNVGW